MSSESFTTGAKRGSQVGKGRPDLISPWANQALAAVLEAGAAEYGDRNWEKGIPIMRHMASCKRHIDQFIMRLTEETKDGKVVPVNHLWNAYANLMMAIHTMEMIKCGVLPGELDDRPVYGQPAVGNLIGETNPVRLNGDGYAYYIVDGCPEGQRCNVSRWRLETQDWEYWSPETWLPESPASYLFGAFADSDKARAALLSAVPTANPTLIAHKEWLKLYDSSH